MARPPSGFYFAGEPEESDGGNTATRKPIGPALQHEDYVVEAVFNRGESRILTWSLDKTAGLWDTATGKPIGLPLQHEEAVWEAIFNRDESRILSWRSLDGWERIV